MPALAARIIKAQPRRERCDYVFPASGGKAIVNWTALKKRVQKLSGVPDFTFHCVRHTLRAALDRFGFPPHVKDECLNHVRKDIGGRHYSHYDYRAEQLEAFERWAAHVEKLVWGDRGCRRGSGWNLRVA